MLATTCMAPWRYVRPRSVSSAATATTMRRLRRRFRKEEATLPKEKEPDQDGSKQWPAQIGRLAAGTREAKVARSVIAVIIKALQQWPLYARGHWAQAHSTAPVRQAARSRRHRKRPSLWLAAPMVDDSTLGTEGPVDTTHLPLDSCACPLSPSLQLSAVAQCHARCSKC